ncbi:MAG: TetR/AcrR family transcriptional regulator [Nocardioidaceae bacterium]
MNESASTDRRETHRRQTASRINSTALQFADEHGLDGFSMEELAEAADVSRRTLFNYFPGKDAAVLGDAPELDPTVTAEFVAGKPTGHLLTDLVALVEAALPSDAVNLQDLARLRHVLAAEPRLMGEVFRRFDAIGEQVVRLIATREGPGHDAFRARIAFQLLTAMFGVSIKETLANPDTPFLEVFEEAVATARSVFA